LNPTEREFSAALATAAGESDAFESRTIAKVAWRLIPFLLIGFFLAFVDRVNVGFANAMMSHDLGLSTAAFGRAAGIFFIGYFLFEVPSNLALSVFWCAGLAGAHHVHLGDHVGRSGFRGRRGRR
jgi:hypothetical protein